MNVKPEIMAKWLPFLAQLNMLEYLTIQQLLRILFL